MRYAPPGLCLNDFAVLPTGAGYTVLHLQGPWTERFDHLTMETSYGRATSDDLVHWQPQGTPFGVGRPGRFDHQAVWTMHPFAFGEGLAMLYTGVEGVTAGGWPLQSVGLACSARTDGTGWQRRGDGPVVRADPRWYRTGEHMGWRDPFVVRHDEEECWAMVVCASDASLPVERAGCVGFATSGDLLNWQVHPPVLTPGDVAQFECPVLERLDDGRWLLMGSIDATHDIRAWTAPRLAGPWQPHGPLGPQGAYAPRVVTAPDGRRVVLHTVQRRAGLHDGGELCRGMLAQPKLLRLRDGRPELAWWSGLDALTTGPSTGPDLNAVGDIALTGPLEVVLRTAGGRAALTVGYADGTIRVNGAGGARLAGTRVAAGPGRLRILTVGEYVEVYLDGTFVLTALSYAGRPVPWVATSGAGSWNVPTRGLALPDAGRDDASAPWPGPAGPA